MFNLTKENSIIFGLTASADIAEKVAQKTKIKLGEILIKKFADGEIFVESKSSVRNKSVFIIQSTNSPANDNIMELLLTIDSFRRSSAGEINVVIPYFGYSRQDRRDFGRQPISTKLISNLLTVAGVTRIIMIDIHSEQTVGFFDIPVDNLRAVGIIAKEIKKLKIPDLVVVSPDHGGVVRTRQLAKLLDTPLAIVDKRRSGHNKVEESINILGDVKNKNIIIYDDIVDTGGTVQNAVKALKKNGANKVYFVAIHSVLSNNSKGEKAIDVLKKSGLEMLITTNSISKKAYENDSFVKIIDLSNIIAEIVETHIEGKSITNYFIKNYNTNL